MRNGLEEYRRPNFEDNKTFRRWLLANTVVGAFALLVLVTVALLPSGDTATTAKIASSIALSHAR
jgi:hypothetical protein